MRLTENPETLPINFIMELKDGSDIAALGNLIAQNYPQLTYKGYVDGKGHINNIAFFSVLKEGYEKIFQTELQYQGMINWKEAKPATVPTDLADMVSRVYLVAPRYVL